MLMMARRSDRPHLQALTLDVDEVAQLLGVSRRTVYRLLDAGSIPKPIDLGTCRRWRRADIELFVAAGSMSAFRRAKAD